MKNYLLPVLALTFFSCKENKNESTSTKKEVVTETDTLKLPAPDEKNSKNKFSNVIGWPKGKTPVAPEGFTVTRFADNIKSPRNMIQAENGDIFVVLSNSERSTTEKIKNDISGKSDAEVGGKSANRIILYRDANKDGVAESSSVFLDKLNQPYGMLIIKDKFYVANTDGLWVYSYKPGDTKITQPGKKIVNLPAKCTVSIFTVGGTLVRKYNRDVPADNSDGQVYSTAIPNRETSLDWDLKNFKGIRIASGVYLIHVDAPGLGTKTIKWFGMTRPLDLDTF